MKMTSAQIEAALGDLIAGGGSFDPAATFVGVATAVDEHGQATVLADVAQATGGLATRYAVAAWSDPYPLVDGRWAVEAATFSFSPGGGDPAQVLTHWYLASLAVAGVLKGWGAFNPALTITGGGAPARLVLRLTLDPNGSWDANVQWNG